MRRRLAVDGGVDGEDHLPHVATRDALNEARQIEIRRADAIERRKRPAQHMIARVERRSALQRPEIGDGLDDDEQGRVAPLVAADRAGVKRVDIAADAADDDFFARGLHRLGERTKQLLALADEMQTRRGAPSAARAPAGAPAAG